MLGILLGYANNNGQNLINAENMPEISQNIKIEYDSILSSLNFFNYNNNSKDLLNNSSVSISKNISTYSTIPYYSNVYNQS